MGVTENVCECILTHECKREIERIVENCLKNKKTFELFVQFIKPHLSHPWLSNPHFVSLENRFKND